MPTQTDNVRITYLLTFEAPFHFGTGMRQGVVDRIVARDADGYLYVPGSTLKGTLRERCEQLAKLLSLQSREPHDEVNALAEFDPNMDIVARIFGSRVYPGKLYFDDASLIAEHQQFFDHTELRLRSKYRRGQVETRTQSSLSRRTRTARAGMLYTSEWGLRALQFEGAIYGTLEGFAFREVSGTYSLVLLVAGLHAVDHVGGNTSTGGGRCRIEITDLVLNGETQEPAQLLNRLEYLYFYHMAREDEV